MMQCVAPTIRAAGLAPAVRRGRSGRMQVRVAAAGLSKEQQEFLERKAREARASTPAPPAQRRAGTERRPTSRPATRAAPPPPPAPAAPAPVSYEPYQARAASPAPTERRRGGGDRPRATTPRPSSRPVAPSPPAPAASAPASYQPHQEPERTSDVDFARVALERTLEREAAPHPNDSYATTTRRAASPAPLMPAGGASSGRWPEHAFAAATIAAFPEKSVASVEEARVLLDAGYILLDVRTELESNAKGKLRGSVCIPCAFAKQAYDASVGEMVTVVEDNPRFLAQVERKFPRKDTPIIVACSNGHEYAIDVLEALEEEGYTRIVGLQGGVNAFTRTFDLRLNPRDGRPVARREMKKLL